MTNVTAAEAAIVLRDLANTQPYLQSSAEYRRWLMHMAACLDGHKKTLPVWAALIDLVIVSLYVELRKGANSPLTVERSKGKIEVYLGGFYLVACSRKSKRSQG